jgi:DNA polymerase III, alpha subunit (gram-positive type)
MITLFYDFETSGLNIFHEDVIEIGCKCLEDGEVFTCLVKPLSDKQLSDKIISLTGISDGDLLKDGLPCKEAFTQFFDFIKGYYDNDKEVLLIAHNGRSFDDMFLKRMHRYLQGEELTTYDEMMDNLYFIDSLLVTKCIFPTIYSHSMYNLCKYFNIKNEQAHRAMGDVNALELIWVEVNKMLKYNKTEVSGDQLRYITYA